jgi:hypothetical protein
MEEGMMGYTVPSYSNGFYVTVCTDCYEKWKNGNHSWVNNGFSVPPEKWFWFEKICKECQQLAEEKNNLYGGLAISTLGGKGLFVRIWDKVNRLKSLIWEEKDDTPDEKVKDTLMDLINYAVFTILVKEGKWS